ncbi:MAG TPA: phosphatase PAP2 family protein [Solirubrobacteraceae bacterium]|nr:phosphatase PAP2 family protein [Solirubrobacteraceae bacterium]
MSSAVSIDRGGAPAALGPAASSAGRIAAPAAAPARARWWVELLVIGWLLFLYDAVNNLAPLRLSVALGNARGILHVERLLHIDPELTLDRWLASHRTLADVLANYYDNAHFVVTLGLLGYLWWSRADIYRPLRNVLVLVNVIGFLVFWLFPVAPPRMLDGFTDVVASTHAFGSWHTGALASQANQLAAMPSLHMAWAGWCTLALWRITGRRWVRALALAYPCMTALAVLATGNHFVLDIAGGLLALALAVLLVGSPERLGGRLSASRLRAVRRARGATA